MKDKTLWYYCKQRGLKTNPEYPKFKMNYCKLGYEECNQGYRKCDDFEYSKYKSFKRFFFLRKLWIELQWELHLGYHVKYIYIPKIKRIFRKINNILGELIQAFLFTCELIIICFKQRKELMKQFKENTIYLIKNRKFQRGIAL